MVVAAGEKSTAESASLLDSIWEIVRDRGLKTGDQLPSIRELAETLGEKQSAVRDAILKAEAMGLVHVLPRAGAFLRAGVPAALANGASLDEPLAGSLQDALLGGEQNLFHLLDARRLIEIELAGRAAERRRLEDLLPVRRALEAMLQLPADAARPEYVAHDVRFHIEIARLSGNLVLFAIQRTLMELLRPHLNEAPLDPERRTKTDRSHVAIYEALVAGDAEKARREMREHLSLAYDGLLRDIQQVPALQR
ncbi:MAG TPA: FCD domain-containing protein [Pirellulales bacterium]|nr:FCD domain-containing protein [Pirellulales bacterium]